MHSLANHNIPGLCVWMEYVIYMLPLSNSAPVISEVYGLSSCITEQICLFLLSQLSACKK